MYLRFSSYIFFYITSHTVVFVLYRHCRLVRVYDQTSQTVTWSDNGCQGEYLFEKL